MSIAALVDEAQNLGAVLYVRDGELRLKAPDGFPVELKARLRNHKPAIAAWLVGRAPSPLPPAAAGNNPMTTGHGEASADPEMSSPPQFYTFDRYREAVGRWGQAVADELIDLLPPWWRAHFGGDEAGKAEAAARFRARWQELVQKQPKTAGGAGAPSKEVTP